LAPSACKTGQSRQFSMASSGPSSPPHRSTQSRKPRSSKYFSKNSRQAAVLARISSRSRSAQVGGESGESIEIVGRAADVGRSHRKTTRPTRKLTFRKLRALQQIAMCLLRLSRCFCFTIRFQSALEFHAAAGTIIHEPTERPLRLAALAEG